MVQKYLLSIWHFFQLTVIFHLLSFSGILFFGIGPAWQTILTLYLIHQKEPYRYTLREAFRIWKHNFKRANLYFWMMTPLFLALIFNLNLSMQGNGVFWYLLTFLIFVLIIIGMLFYVYLAFYESIYELSIWDNYKLAGISLIIDIRRTLILTIAMMLMFIVTWYCPVFYLFLTFGINVFLFDKLTKPVRKIIDDLFIIKPTRLID